jgi:hypothetical protein
VEIVAVVYLGYLVQMIVDVVEFAAKAGGDPSEIAVDPTDRLEVPIVGEPDEAGRRR